MSSMISSGKGTYSPRVKVEVQREVHEALRELKQRGESFNDVIARLIEVLESQKCIQKCSGNCSGNYSE